MPKSKEPKLTYKEFLEKVRAYINTRSTEVSGVAYVCKNEKWLDIYYSNHENKAFADLIKDDTFKQSLGIVKEKKKRGTGKGKEEK